MESNFMWTETLSWLVVFGVGVLFTKAWVSLDSQPMWGYVALGAGAVATLAALLTVLARLLLGLR